MSDSKTRAVRHLSIAYFVPFTGADGNKTVLVRTARRGETVDTSVLAPGEEERLDGLGALLPPGSTAADVDADQQARLDAYRGVRGDSDALARHSSRIAGGGGIVNIDAPTADSPNALAEWIRENRPNVDDTVALAEGDPAKAARVLEAEGLATDGSPRAGVESKLSKLASGE